MPSLPNPRHERFAQELASGKSATDALAEAGYLSDRRNGSRLTTNEDIRRRVAALQERGAMRTEITIEKLTAMLLEDRKAARAAGQFGPAISALEKIAKLHGVFDKRRQNRKPLGVVSRRPLTPEEWVAKFDGKMLDVT